MKLKIRYLFLFIFCLIPVAQAATHKVQGNVAVETRYFTQDPLHSGQRDSDTSIVFQPEYYSEWQDGYQSFTFSPFFRWDQHDKERTHFDLRELFYMKASRDWEFSIGLKRIFWGVLESQHLVDIINQTDSVENLDTEDKLGQPMVHFSWIQDWGVLDFFFMTFFRERTFVGRKGRLRTLRVVDQENPVYESDAEIWHPEWAVRYSHTFGGVDLGIAHFMGTSRAPRLVSSTVPDKLDLFTPHYDTINQTSIDAQYTKGDWLWKMEGVTVSGQGDAYIAFGAGFEYTRVGAFGTAMDLGLLAEYHFDSRGNRSTTGFDNDLFWGARLTINDVAGTEVLTGLTMDLESAAVFYNLEASRRLNDHLKLSLEARFFAHAPTKDPLFAIHRDDYLQAELAHYF